ncbi:MAG TPA: hypothetical protein VIG80_07065, partial [Bacillaceae bacterium]
AVITVLAATFTGIGVPLPSSYIQLAILTNSIFAFASIFLQTAVIVIYEKNVRDEPETLLGHAFKYVAIYTSGMNYHIQKVLRRLPFVLNKLGAVVLFLLMLWSFFLIIGIFNS